LGAVNKLRESLTLSQVQNTIAPKSVEEQIMRRTQVGGIKSVGEAAQSINGQWLETVRSGFGMTGNGSDIAQVKIESNTAQANTWLERIFNEIGGKSTASAPRISGEVLSAKNIDLQIPNLVEGFKKSADFRKNFYVPKLTAEGISEVELLKTQGIASEKLNPLEMRLSDRNINDFGFKTPKLNGIEGSLEAYNNPFASKGVSVAEDFSFKPEFKADEGKGGQVEKLVGIVRNLVGIDTGIPQLALANKTPIETGEDMRSFSEILNKILAKFEGEPIKREFEGNLNLSIDGKVIGGNNPEATSENIRTALALQITESPLIKDLANRLAQVENKNNIVNPPLQLQQNSP
jgi:hypothetical protein